MTQQIIDFCERMDIPFLQQEPLKDHCTFRIGGPASLFVMPTTEKQISEIARFVSQKDIPLLILGKGSNVLFSDAGYKGVILHLGNNFAQMKQINETTLYSESGAALTDLCRFAQQHGLSGMEPLFGIPGSVGGAIFMNAGAYGGEMKQVLTKTTHVDKKGSVGAFEGEAMGLGYRHSTYTEEGQIITGGIFHLTPGDPEEIQERMNDFMKRRRDRQPLEYPSAGSTFKRPPGGYASALIDECGLKGYRVGGAEVSRKHAGFVINIEHATAQDVLAVIDGVKKEVLAQKNIALEPEIKLMTER